MDFSLTRRLLWKELSQSDLLLSAPDYQMYIQKVYERGNHVFNNLLPITQSVEWKISNNQLHRPFSRADLVRVFGFGNLLTEFAIAPVCSKIATQELEMVVHLGTLANWIVTLFDKFAENNTTEIVDLQTIERLYKGDKLVFSDGHSQRLLEQLIQSYFKTLKALPYAASRNTTLAFIYHVISSMYIAEISTLKVSQPTRQILRQKSGLPFITMGLPIWLLSEDIPLADRCWHLGWLYRLGDFIGWIDDIIDLEADLQNGEANQVHYKFGNNSPSETLTLRLTKWVALKGLRLKHEWEEHNNSGVVPPLTGFDILSAVIVSWFGGTGPY